MRSYSIATAVKFSPHLLIRTGCHDPGDENVPKRRPNLDSLKTAISDNLGQGDPSSFTVDGD